MPSSPESTPSFRPEFVSLIDDIHALPLSGETNPVLLGIYLEFGSTQKDEAYLYARRSLIDAYDVFVEAMNTFSRLDEAPTTPPGIALHEVFLWADSLQTYDPELVGYIATEAMHTMDIFSMDAYEKQVVTPATAAPCEKYDQVRGDAQSLATSMTYLVQCTADTRASYAYLESPFIRRFIDDPKRLDVSRHIVAIEGHESPAFDEMTRMLHLTLLDSAGAGMEASRAVRQLVIHSTRDLDILHRQMPDYSSRALRLLTAECILSLPLEERTMAHENQLEEAYEKLSDNVSAYLQLLAAELSHHGHVEPEHATHLRSLTLNTQHMTDHFSSKAWSIIAAFAPDDVLIDTVKEHREYINTEAEHIFVDRLTRNGCIEQANALMTGERSGELRQHALPRIVRNLLTFYDVTGDIVAANTAEDYLTQIKRDDVYVPPDVAHQLALRQYLAAVHNKHSLLALKAALTLEAHHTDSNVRERNDALSLTIRTLLDEGRVAEAEYYLPDLYATNKFLGSISVLAVASEYRETDHDSDAIRIVREMLLGKPYVDRELIFAIHNLAKGQYANVIPRKLRQLDPGRRHLLATLII